jgi:hypothetical protein
MLVRSMTSRQTSRDIRARSAAATLCQLTQLARSWGLARAAPDVGVRWWFPRRVLRLACKDWRLILLDARRRMAGSADGAGPSEATPGQLRMASAVPGNAAPVCGISGRVIHPLAQSALANHCASACLECALPILSSPQASRIGEIVQAPARHQLRRGHRGGDGPGLWTQRQIGNEVWSWVAAGQSMLRRTSLPPW